MWSLLILPRSIWKEGLQLQTWVPLLELLNDGLQTKGLWTPPQSALHYPTASPVPVSVRDFEGYFIGQQPPLSSIIEKSLKSESLFSFACSVSTPLPFSARHTRADYYLITFLQ